MSQMPDKIWLHKDTKYSTADTVCGYQYDFVQGIEDEGGIGKEEMLEKAVKWLEEHSWEYLIGDNFKDEKMISDFRKAMEE